MIGVLIRSYLLKQVRNNVLLYRSYSKATLYTDEDVVEHNYNNQTYIGEIITSGPITEVKDWLRASTSLVASAIEVWLPRSVKKIGENAFRYMRDLTAVHLPDGLQEIGAHSFNTTTNVIFSELPDSVIKLGGFCFVDCRKVTLSRLPSNLITIESQALRGTGITITEIPQGVTTIGKKAFAQTGYIPYLVINKTTPPTLGEDAFGQTTYDIYVPDSAVDTYKAASGWSAIASRIKPLSEKPS